MICLFHDKKVVYKRNYIAKQGVGIFERDTEGCIIIESCIKCGKRFSYMVDQFGKTKVDNDWIISTIERGEYIK